MFRHTAFVVKGIFWNLSSLNLRCSGSFVGGDFVCAVNRRDVGKLFMIGIYGTELSEETKEILSLINPGFLILFSRNVVGPEQVRNLINDVSNFLGYKPIISVDQEGGNVVRLKEGFTIMPSAMACAATDDPELVRRAVKVTSLEMKVVGIDWNLAPVVDVNMNPLNPVIGIRSYGDEPGRVVQFANSFVSGSHEAGIATCLKHFPGLGSVSVDPHFDLPVIDKSIEELYEVDLFPFKNVKSYAWMPSHVYFPRIQKDGLPASLSRFILKDIARDMLGFDGVIVADDLLMGGVSKFTLEKRVIDAFDAGNDVLTICHEPNLQLRAFDAFCDYVENSEDAQKNFSLAFERIDRFSKMVKASSERFPEDKIEEDERVVEKLIRKSITVVNANGYTFPIDRVDIVLSMINVTNTPVAEDQTLFVPNIAKEMCKIFNCELLMISEENLPKLSELRQKNVVLFTYDAYRNPTLKAFLKELDASSKLLLIALKNPYDALYVKNSIALYGSSPLQQKMLLDVLLGKSTAQGTLPLKNRGRLNE